MTEPYPKFKEAKFDLIEALTNFTETFSNEGPMLLKRCPKCFAVEQHGMINGMQGAFPCYIGVLVNTGRKALKKAANGKYFRDMDVVRR